MFSNLIISPEFYHFTKEIDNNTIEVPKEDNDGNHISRRLAYKIAKRRCLC